MPCRTLFVAASARRPGLNERCPRNYALALSFESVQTRSHVRARVRPLSAGPQSPACSPPPPVSPSTFVRAAASHVRPTAIITNTITHLSYLSTRHRHACPGIDGLTTDASSGGLVPLPVCRRYPPGVNLRHPPGPRGILAPRPIGETERIRDFPLKPQRCIPNGRIIDAPCTYSVEEFDWIKGPLDLSVLPTERGDFLLPTSHSGYGTDHSWAKATSTHYPY